MGELIALDLPAGPGFVEALRRAWDGGDAVLPIDTRLPKVATDRLLDVLRPARVISPDGIHALAGSVPTEPDDALVVATSGTTGEPKGVVHTHASVAASALSTSAGLDVDPARDRWVACLPLAHIGGLSVITRSLVTGTPCTVLERFDPRAVEDEARRGATLVSLVATVLERTDVSGFRAVLLGGAAPPSVLPSNVVATYGMTETGSGCVYHGRALDGVELRIGDGTLGSEGEVLVRGPMLLRAYRYGTDGDGDGIDGAGIDPRIENGWFPTGDGGRLDEDGTLTIFGRMAEVIVTGAEKVWPGPVEEVLATHSSIAEVAVWKRADPVWGERVVAYVVVAPGASLPELGDLRELVADRIARWAAPRQLVVVDALPKTASGKVRRADLV